jgi:outer membrane protein assembly factor BamB/ABC-type phosphate/phosphonate transport system substrate-binding protein
MNRKIGQLASGGLPASAHRTLVGGLLVFGLAASLGDAQDGVSSHRADQVRREDATLRLLVMDPLSNRLACDCVGDYAQRDYDKLGRELRRRLDRPVVVSYAEAISSATAQSVREIDLIIGKFTEVVSDAQRVGIRVRPIALLSDRRGKVLQEGLFVVRDADEARSVGDLVEHRILFGPEDADEKHSAARNALEAFGISVPADVAVKPSCSAAALAVVERDADAAVVSSYAMPLLEGCGTIGNGELRIVGTTGAVPFIALFTSKHFDRDLARSVLRALQEAGKDAGLLSSLESRDGFVPLAALDGIDALTPAWPDWRGPKRDGISRDVPDSLPQERRLLWSRTMTGVGMSGLAVGANCVVVADKNLDETQDIFHCLDADTGDEKWRIRYPAAGEMDFTNSPRANPVIYQGLVYLLGAFGDLHCAELATGKVVWKKHLVRDFHARRPQWGYSSTPLLVGDSLIVTPGAPDAALAALDRRTGDVIWKTAGDPPGYASFVRARLGGVDQIVGYDAVSLGGWDPANGKRLWRLIPELDGDFNVPTPIVVDEKILVTSENNGTRLYGFGRDGRIDPKPLAVNQDLTPDTSTPLVLDGLVFGNFGGLMCLDLEGGLATRWESDAEGLTDYCSFIGGNGHLFVMSQMGRLFLVEADRESYQCKATLDLFHDVPDTDREVWSHPALVGNRLYVRNLLSVYCFLLN